MMRFLKRGSEIARAAADLVLDEDRPAAGAAQPEPEAAEAAPAADPDPEPEAAPEPAADPDPQPDLPAAAAEADVAAARAEERQRVTDVFASEASVGKERVAASLLADSDMPADKIIGLLPKLGADASDAMLASLRGTANPDLAAGTEAAGTRPGDAAASWSKTFDRLGWSEPKN